MADSADKPTDEPGMTIMSLGEHLEELRTRLIRSLVAAGLAFIVCFTFRDYLRVVIQRPHVSAMRAFDLATSLKFGGYFESVVAQLKVCAVFGFMLVSPYVIYQVWAFVAPGLFPNERSKGVKLGAACVVCFVSGVAFGYFVFIPIALRYLVRLAGGWAEPMLMIGKYLSLLFLLTFALGMAFQTPVVVYYLIRWGVLKVETLQAKRKHVILGAFVVAAVMTPPDPVTQVMMALTLIILYDLGGLLAAPSWETFKGFLKFTGGIMLVAVAFVLWFRYWPVAQVSMLRGELIVGEQEVPAEGAVGARRGSFWQTAEGGGLRVAFGGDDDPVVYVGGDSRLQLHGPGDVSFYRGKGLVVNPNARREVTVRTAAAKAILTDARAEFAMLDKDAVTVTVFDGTVTVTTEGRTRLISAGQTATFRRGGEPAELSGAEQHWRELIEGTEQQNAKGAEEGGATEEEEKEKE